MGFAISMAKSTIPHIAAATIITSMGTTSFQGGFTHKSAEHYESLLIIVVSGFHGNKKAMLTQNGYAAESGKDMRTLPAFELV